MFHSTIRDLRKSIKNTLKKLIIFIDLVVVNSEGSRADISEVVNGDKVIVNHHFASKEYFEGKKNTSKNSDYLKILYVGRIDKDKLCFPLIKFAKKSTGSDKFHFTFVGAGSDVDKIKSVAKENKNVTFLGYIGETKQLSRLYREADVLWTFADTTYLALPAIEALASGTPIVVPEFAAITGRKEKINKSLVPEEIGWLVDPYNDIEIERLLERIRTRKEFQNKDCIPYAKKFYSEANLKLTIEKIENILTP